MTVFVVEYEVEYEEDFGRMSHFWELDRIFSTLEAAKKYIDKMGGLDHRVTELEVLD